MRIPTQQIALYVLCVSMALPVFSQTKSAIQFYDSTGSSKTGRIGWSGDAAGGHLFLQTPADGEILKTRSGGVEVSGSMSAARFSGDGSGLTNLPSPAVTVGTVTGLQDSLNKKANTADLTSKPDTNWVKTRLTPKADTVWVNGKLGPKADTGWVTAKIAGIGTAQIPDGAVTTAKIADKAVTNAKIDSVDWAKVSNKPTIPSGSIADGSVTTTKIANTAVTDAKIESVSWAKVTGKPARYPTHSDSVTWTAGTAGQVWKMGSNGTPAWGTDLQGTSTGVTQITAGTGMTVSPTTGTGNVTVAVANIPGSALADAAVPFAKIAANAVDSTKIINGGIAGADINTSARLTIESLSLPNGQIGVGTTAPGCPIDIHVPNSGDNTFLAFSNIVGGYADIASFEYNVVTGIAVPPLQLRLDRNRERPFAVMGGNVGIGTLSPVSKLQVCGTITAEQALATQLCSSSDARFKTEISPISSALDIISKLNGVYYSWDRKEWPQKNFPQSRQVGLIAQDVEKVLPEVVATDPEGYKALAYDKLTAVLIEAVKEQGEVIKKLENRITLQDLEIRKLISKPTSQQ